MLSTTPLPRSKLHLICKFMLLRNPYAIQQTLDSLPPLKPSRYHSNNTLQLQPKLPEPQSTNNPASDTKLFCATLAALLPYRGLSTTGYCNTGTISKKAMPVYLDLLFRFSFPFLDSLPQSLNPKNTKRKIVTIARLVETLLNSPLPLRAPVSCLQGKLPLP